MSNDAIVMLREDHKRIKALFREFAAVSEKSGQQRERVVRQILEELTVHTYIENEVMYPRVRELVPELEHDVLESYEEHHVADVLSVEIAALSPDDERFVPKVTVLIENVTHHITEEEQEWFPQVRERLTRTQLREIGTELGKARESAPTEPTQPSAMKKALDALIT